MIGQRGLFAIKAQRPQGAWCSLCLCGYFLTILFTFLSCAQAQTLAQATQLRQKGDYKGAEAALAALSQKGDAVSRIAYCRLLTETGKYSEAEAAARAGGDPALALELSNALRAQGKYSEAESAIAGSSLPEGRFALAELLARRGESGRARELYRLAAAQPRGRNGLLAAAQSLQRLGDFHGANSLFQDLGDKYPDDFDVKLAWAELFLEKYNAAEASGLFQEILKENNHHPAALVGMVRCVGDSSDPKVDELLDRALKTNPNLIDIFQIRARRFIEDERYDAAAAQLEQAEKIDAQNLDNWALRGALAYFRQQDPQPFLKKVEAVNSHDGRAWHQLGQLCVSRKRFDKAIEFFQKAIAHDPELWQAHADLGINLLRQGVEREGKEALERAYSGDPFHVWTVNTLRLLDTFKYYRESQTPHFRLRIHAREEVLRDLAEELLEQSYAAFQQRYGFSPSFQTSIEFYPNHEDFAVRTLGVPGLGALGAAFGKVAALDSPMARKRGEYNWGSTLWHEVAHIFTLNLSDMKVPRWLTEGLSTYEERLARPGWGRKIDPMLVQASEKKMLLPLKELSVGFLHPQFPDQIVISYTQASFVCQFLAERYGWEKIRQLLQAFRDKSEADAFKAVYGKSLDELDAEFRSYFQPLVQKVAGQLDKSSTSEYAKLLRDAEEHLKNNEWSKALPPLRRAVELEPEPRYPFNVWFKLAEVEEKLGHKKDAMEAYMKAGRLLEAAEEPYRRAFDLAVEQSQSEVASAAYQSLMFIYPEDVELNKAMGEAWLKWNQPERAVAPLARATRIPSGDAAQNHYLLARAYFLSGKRDLARKAVLVALDAAPSFEKAQQLLLQIAEGRQ